MHNLTVCFSMSVMQQKVMIIGGRFYKEGGNVVECNNEARSCNHCCHGKAMLHILSLCL